MRRKVILRPEIAGDLHDIVDYLDQNSAEAGDRFIVSVFLALDRLAEMPGIGSPKRFRVHRDETIRSWSVPHFRNYIIYYQARLDAVLVLAVLHGARDVPAALRGRALPRR